MTLPIKHQVSRFASSNVAKVVEGRLAKLLWNQISRRITIGVWRTIFIRLRGRIESAVRE